MADLFPNAPRRPRRTMMRVIDSGEGMAGYPFGAELECSRCGHKTGWLCFTTAAEIKRQPCPKCNASEEIAAAIRGQPRKPL